MSTPVSTTAVSLEDFHNLLAFAVAESSLNRRGPLPSLDPTFLLPDLAKISPGLNAKVTKILDALALICVRKTGHVFAVAAEVEHSPNLPDAITLTVAENSGRYGGMVTENNRPCNGTVAHLCRV